LPDGSQLRSNERLAVGHNTWQAKQASNKYVDNLQATGSGCPAFFLLPTQAQQLQQLQ
jgi:hypothetical protein